MWRLFNYSGSTFQPLSEVCFDPCDSSTISLLNSFFGCFLFSFLTERALAKVTKTSSPPNPLLIFIFQDQSAAWALWTPSLLPPRLCLSSPASLLHLSFFTDSLSSAESSHFDARQGSVSDTLLPLHAPSWWSLPPRGFITAFGPWLTHPCTLPRSLSTARGTICPNAHWMSLLGRPEGGCTSTCPRLNSGCPSSLPQTTEGMVLLSFQLLIPETRKSPIPHIQSLSKSYWFYVLDRFDG